MPRQNIRLSSLMGGKTTVSQSGRLPQEVEEMENCDINVTRGVDKRAGTEPILGEEGGGSLLYTDPTNVTYTFWINRSPTERFVGFLDPDATLDKDTIQIFNVIDGTRQTVEALASTGAEVTLDDADVDVVAMIAYLRSGTQTARQRFRTVSVEDALFILNREVNTALAGADITYRDAGDTTDVRDQNYLQNVTAWSDFTHPPATFSGYPTEATLITGGDILGDEIWYAEDDDVGLPQGFYWAVSGTQPPWFQRLPTEPENSFLDKATMPLRLDWDGAKFVLKFVDWTARYAGDGTTNPGPTFIGTNLSDMTFHQGRFWFVAGERVVSSRAGDLFNLWINSVALLTDDDPIDDGIQGNRISNGIFAESFRESLIIITDGSRQMELRANGPITPNSYQLYDSTNIFSVDYVEPTIKGAQLFFASEVDFSNNIYAYDYSPQQVNNLANDITIRARGYIPAELHWMTASEAHDQLFALTLAEDNVIYVNKANFSGAQQTLNSWYRWTFPNATAVLSCFVFDNYLYLVFERGGLRFLERMALGEPAQDTDGTPTQTLGYAVRHDRKVKIQGVYDDVADTTTWTLPYLDPAVDSVVLAATWDTETVKAGGTPVYGFDVTEVGGITVLSIEGDYENNADGVDSPAYIGTSYDAEAELSELFVRDQNGNPLYGVTQVLRGKIRHRDAGGYSIKITPEGRNELCKTFVPPFYGSTPIDTEQLVPFGEFQFRVMSHSRNLTIKLVNSTPFPTAWVDMEFDVEFVPQSYSPVR